MANGDMTRAFIRQLKEHNKSVYIDRTGWTRQQWIDDASELMNHPDGAITSLVNGHVLALLDEAQEAGERKALRRTIVPPMKVTNWKDGGDY